MDPPLCLFFSKGTCRNGTSCKFLHAPKASVTVEKKEPVLELCSFYRQGKCRYGNLCRFVHEDGNKVEVAPEQEICCGICLEKITRFGLLEGCNHSFCIKCIQSWRNEALNCRQETKKSNARSCPLCREHSHFVVSSNQYHKDEEKHKFISGKAVGCIPLLRCTHNTWQTIKNYPLVLDNSLLSPVDTIAHRAKIPCAQYLEGHCAFGSSCFYGQFDANGNDVKIKQKEELLREKVKRKGRERSSGRYIGRQHMSEAAINGLLLAPI